jgi:hypothetical protein
VFLVGIVVVIVGVAILAYTSATKKSSPPPPPPPPGPDPPPQTIMYGPSVANASPVGVPIVKKTQNPVDNSWVFVALDTETFHGENTTETDQLVKMVSTAGDAYYYVGDMTTFDITKISTYTPVPAGAYLVK